MTKPTKPTPSSSIFSAASSASASSPSAQRRVAQSEDDLETDPLQALKDRADEGFDVDKIHKWFNTTRAARNVSISSKVEPEMARIISVIVEGKYRDEVQTKSDFFQDALITALNTKWMKILNEREEGKLVVKSIRAMMRSMDVETQIEDDKKMSQIIESRTGMLAENMKYPRMIEKIYADLKIDVRIMNERNMDQLMGGIGRYFDLDKLKALQDIWDEVNEVCEEFTTSTTTTNTKE